MGLSQLSTRRICKGSKSRDHFQDMLFNGNICLIFMYKYPWLSVKSKIFTIRHHEIAGHITEGNPFTLFQKFFLICFSLRGFQNWKYFVNAYEGSKNIEDLFHNTPIISTLAAKTIQRSYNNLKITYRKRIEALTEQMTGQTKFVYPDQYIKWVKSLLHDNFYNIC